MDDQPLRTGDDWAGPLGECQIRSLEMLAEGAPLDAVLEYLILTMERSAGNFMLGSILLLNDEGTHFRHAIGPSMHDGFNAAVEGVAIGSGLGICCHAVNRRETVIVPDVAADPAWAAFAAFLAPYGLRAGWSTPIIGAKGAVLGTFANYYRISCEPTLREQHWARVVARTAAIAIERARADAVLRENEKHLRLLVNELNHRVKNTLAIVQGLARQTFRDSGATREARRAFEGRLAALAAAHTLLTQENWESADLKEVATATAGAQCDASDRFTIAGPPVRLEPRTAVNVAMALHELCTNADQVWRAFRAAGACFAFVGGGGRAQRPPAGDPLAGKRRPAGGAAGAAWLRLAHGGARPGNRVERGGAAELRARGSRL